MSSYKNKGVDEKVDMIETGLLSSVQRPTLYREVREMLELSTMIYCIAEYRMWATSSSGSSSRRELPYTVEDVESMFNDSLEPFLEKYRDDGVQRVKLIEGILQNIKELDGTSASEKFKILAFSDEKQDEGELVYFIAVNHLRKRVSLVFRGSVTRHDLFADLKALQIPVPIGEDRLPGFKSVTLHKGFYDYLFRKNQEDGETKYETILEQLRAIFADYPDYQLYVTGHSLGGALCTIFSVFASTQTDSGLPLPISCFSYASPKLGTQGFLRLMQKAEMDGSLRYVRTLNNHDPVANVPKDLFLILPTNIICCCLVNIASQKNQFRHGGMELRLFRKDCCNKGGYRLSHLPDDRYPFFRQLLVRSLGAATPKYP